MKIRFSWFEESSKDQEIKIWRSGFLDLKIRIYNWKIGRSGSGRDQEIKPPCCSLSLLRKCGILAYRKNCQVPFNRFQIKVASCNYFFKCCSLLRKCGVLAFTEKTVIQSIPNLMSSRRDDSILFLRFSVTFTSFFQNFSQLSLG